MVVLLVTLGIVVLIALTLTVASRPPRLPGTMGGPRRDRSRRAPQVLELRPLPPPPPAPDDDEDFLARLGRHQPPS